MLSIFIGIKWNNNNNDRQSKQKVRKIQTIALLFAVILQEKDKNASFSYVGEYIVKLP